MGAEGRRRWEGERKGVRFRPRATAADGPPALLPRISACSSSTDGASSVRSVAPSSSRMRPAHRSLQAGAWIFQGHQGLLVRGSSPPGVWGTPAAPQAEIQVQSHGMARPGTKHLGIERGPVGAAVGCVYCCSTAAAAAAVAAAGAAGVQAGSPWPACSASSSLRMSSTWCTSSSFTFLAPLIPMSRHPPGMRSSRSSRTRVDFLSPQRAAAGQHHPGRTSRGRHA